MPWPLFSEPLQISIQNFAFLSFSWILTCDEIFIEIGDYDYKKLNGFKWIYRYICLVLVCKTECRTDYIRLQIISKTDTIKSHAYAQSTHTTAHT